MSQAKYAVANEVDETTLRKWKKKDVFVAEWKKRVDVIQGSPERTQLLLDSLYNKGVAGDVKSAQLYLQATNRISPPTVSVSMDKKTKELTDAELDSLIGVLASREKSNRALRVVYQFHFFNANALRVGLPFGFVIGPGMPPILAQNDLRRLAALDPALSLDGFVVTAILSLEPGLAAR